MYLKLFMIAVLMLFISCSSKKDENSAENLDPNAHKVEVNEVKQSKVYTYLLVTENDAKYWMAIAKNEVEEGDVLYYTQSLEMKDFESKELDQKFDTIYFVDKISREPIKSIPAMMKKNPHDNVKTGAKDNISVEPVEGGITIEQLFSDKEQYGGKSIKIKGQVVKFNPEIMGMNWVHIQDGTNFENNFDLTITTKDAVKVGDVVTFEGKVTLDKDFGAGYAYDVVMEEASKE
jgi:hypothetical protein